MNPAYFETHFRIAAGTAPDAWPIEFAIISAYATTGEHWSVDQNQTADRMLETEIRNRSVWLRRIVGYSPVSGHAEPSWAVELPCDDARQLGRCFKQDAIYYVRGDELFVTRCDDGSQLVPVGGFRGRLHECQ